MKQLAIQTALYEWLSTPIEETLILDFEGQTYQIENRPFEPIQSLQDTIDAVYDNVPQDPTFPYVVIGDDTSIPFDTDEELGEESTLTFHIWSRYDGRAEVKGIMGDIYDALHRQPIIIPGALNIDCMFEFSETMLDPDMETRHGVMRFRLLLDYQ